MDGQTVPDKTKEKTDNVIWMDRQLQAEQREDW